MPDLEKFVTQAFDQWVDARYSDRAPDGMWHPSSVSSRCPRKSIYTIRGTPTSDQREAQSKRVLEYGKEIHRLFQRVVKDHPAVAAAYSEVAIFDENGDHLNTPPTVGDTDDIVFYTDGDVEVQEYKSKSSNMMRSKTQIDELPEGEHVIQIKTYMRAISRSGFTTQDGVSHPPVPVRMGRITYLGKDTAQIVECPVVYDPEVDDPVLDARLAYLEAFRKDPDSLPPRLPLVTKHPKGKKAYTDYDWLCKVCPWYYRCWNEDPDYSPAYGEPDASPF